MIIEENFKKTKKETITSPSKNDDGDAFENVLRPKDFDNYVGQNAVKDNLKIFVAASKKRGSPLEHTLFYGPPGLGKTTLAMIISKEMNSNLKISSGPAIEKPGDLASILTNLSANDFLFIDEIHRLRRPVEEILYSAMEDFAIDLIVGKGPSARTMRLDIPPFTLVGATTKASMIAGPLRDRFGHIEKLRFYEHNEIQQIITRSAKILDVKIDEQAAKTLSKCARRTPRIANRLLRRMRDFADILYDGKITDKVVIDGLKKLSVDKKGLDFGDQQFLKALCEKFNGGPVGLSTIAAAIGEEDSTVEEMIEPFLIREGFLAKSARGRIATDAAFTHFGISNLNPMEAKTKLF